MPEAPGSDELNARGIKDTGPPEPPPTGAGGSGSATKPRAHSAKHPGGPPEPPPTANPDDSDGGDHAGGQINTSLPESPSLSAILATIASLGFLAGAHALEAHLTDCLNLANLGLGALELAAVIALIMWVVQTLHAHGPIKAGPPEPPPLSTMPAYVAAGLAAIAGLAGITLGLLEDCLSGLHLLLGVADAIVAGWILILLGQAINADKASK